MTQESGVEIHVHGRHSETRCQLVAENRQFLHDVFVYIYTVAPVTSFQKVSPQII